MPLLSFTLLALTGLGCVDSTGVVPEPESNSSIERLVVPLALVPFESSEGRVLVSSGIPLAAGTLEPREAELVRVIVEGEEQPAFVEALKGRHKDGSVRSVLVQFYHDFGSRPDSARLILGERRTTRDLPRSEPRFTLEAPLPAAVALPASAKYLAETGIVGPVTAAPSIFAQQWEQTFQTVSDQKWALMEKDFGPGLDVGLAIARNYYDRAFFHWAWWVRTADPAYWKRAAYYLIAYRELYMRPNNYVVQPHNAQIGGLELHYLLAGDLESRRGVRRLADVYGGWLKHIGETDHPWNESRIQSRVLLAYITAHALEIDNQDWGAYAREALSLILATQSADGAYRFKSTCSSNLNYMSGLLNEVLAKYHHTFENDARILPSVKRSVDFLWTTQWDRNGGGFKYLSGACPGVGGEQTAPDLNLLIVHGFGWVYNQTGETTYREAGDVVFRNGVQRAWLAGDKQFNQQYRSAYQYLELRNGPEEE